MKCVPWSSGKMLTSGVSGKWRRWRLGRPGCRRLERALLLQHLRKLELDDLNGVAIRGLFVARIVDGERVERVAVARRVDLRLDDRQSAPPEEAADPAEQVLLVGQVDGHLQTGLGA
jgi:hypothetical protein